MEYRKWNLLFAILSIMLFVGCTDKPSEQVVEGFPIDMKLKAERLPQLDSMYTAYAVSSVNGRFLLTAKRMPYFFYIYNKTFGRVAEMAMSGNGNEEWMAPMYTGQLEKGNGEDSIYVLERPTNKLYLLSLKNKALRREVADFSNRKVENLRYVFCLGADRYVGSQDEGQCLPFVMNDGVKTELQHPLPDVAQMGVNARLLLQTQAVLRDTKDKWADAYFSYPMLVIRRVDGTIEQIVKIGKQWPSYTNVHEAPADYCIDVCSSHNAIYLLFNDPKQPNESCVLAIGWDGKPIARYHIKTATAMAVDEDGHRIIAVNDDDSDGVFSMYRF